MITIEEATPYTNRLIKPFNVIDRAVNCTSLKIRKESATPLDPDMINIDDPNDYEWKYDRKQTQIPFWIAGGSVLSAVMNTAVNDYDIFSPKPQEIVDVLSGNQFFKKTWTDPRVVNFIHEPFGYKVQVILRFAPLDIEAIFSTFDFTAVCAAFDGKKFCAHDRFFQDVAQKRLVINAIHHPLSTFQRFIKYAHKGFDVCPIGLMNVAKAIQEMTIDWANPDQNTLEFYPDGTPRFPGVD